MYHGSSSPGLVLDSVCEGRRGRISDGGLVFSKTHFGHVVPSPFFTPLASTKTRKSDVGGFGLAACFRPLVALFKQPSRAELVDLIKEADHKYIRGHETQRSPCPFLNSLANHNYLPRDGRNITQDKLKAALITAGNCSHLLADVLSSIVKPVLHEDGTFTLRLDFRQGDNYTFQEDMFHAFLADADGGPITAPSIARTRVRRDREEKQAIGVPALGLRLWVTTWSQTCILLQTFGDSISIKDITHFDTQEKFPSGG